jgi:hypothetical protein
VTTRDDRLPHSRQYKYFIFRFSHSFLTITSLLALAIITTFPFYLLALVEAKGSIGPIFSFFLEDFLEVFRALYFCEELVIKASSKDVDLLDLESSLLALGTLPLNRNELRSIFVFKPLTSLKGTNRGPRVTSSNINPSPLALMVKASTKSL